MIYIEKEATEKYCPQFFSIAGGHAFPFCIASKCMACRWQEIADIGYSNEVPSPKPIECHDGQFRGYCGLAGRPNINTKL